MPQLHVGDAAPLFSLPDQTGTVHSLKDFWGSWILLYFYPKDDTPGCTTEACSLRDAWSDFSKQKVKVFGISTDPVKSHAKFAEKFHLPFPLLADSEKTMVEDYGVWGKKKFMGREYLGTMRTSFLIDPKGKIAKIYESVKPALHAEEVLKDLKEMSA